MPNSNNYSKITAILSECLDLHQPPVAIRFTDVFPNDLKGPAARVPAGCRFWEDATSTTFVTSATDHGMCAIGIYTHNLQPSRAQQTDLQDALKVFGELGYVRQEDLEHIPVLRSESKYVVYGPLSETTLSPDIVLLFVNAGQALILSEATQQVENDNPPAMGRPACAVVPQVMNTGRAALSLGCCGARAYLNILTDNTAIFAIPGAKLEAYTRRIEVLASANATLSEFHGIRRREVAAGGAPTVKDSLAALGA